MTGEVVQLRKELSWRKVGDEIVVLDLRASVYFAVQGAGAAIWERLASGAREAELVEAVLEEFDVETDQAEADIASFLADLDTRGLLR